MLRAEIRPRANPTNAGLTAQRGRRRTLAETALLVFTFLILSGPPPLRSRDLQAAVASPLSLDPAALLQVFAWLGAAAVVGYLLVVYGFQGKDLLGSLLRDPPTGWYLAFALFGLVSAAWSPSPLYTVFFAAKLLIGVLAAVLLVDYGQGARFDRAIRVLFTVYAAKLAVLLALFLVKPSLVYQAGFPGQELIRPRLAGGVVLEDYGTSPLFVGLLLLTVAAYGDGRTKRVTALIGYGGTWVLVLLSQTRTTIMMGLVFFVIVVSLRRFSRGAAVLLGAAVAGLALSVLWKQTDLVLRLATRGGEGIETLSGRTVAFDYLIERWKESPIVGSGYGAGARVALIDFVEMTGWGIGAGHDVLSTVLVDLGLLGAAILAVVFMVTWGRVIKLWLRSPRLLPEHRTAIVHLTCFAVWMTISCFVGPSIAADAPPFVVLLATAWAMRRLPTRRQPSAAERVRVPR